MKVVINKCYGGFGLSEAAYEKLIEWGIPVRKYTQQTRGADGRYNRPAENEGHIIFDRELTPRGEDDGNDRLYWRYAPDGLLGRYWDTWVNDSREHPLLVRVVEELGDAANGKCAELKIVEIPDGTDYVIDEYDGMESIHERHEVWS